MENKRLIDANALDYALKGLGFRYTPDKGKMFLLIASMPTVDAVEVVHARWIEVRDKHNYCIGMKCNNCGRRVRNCGENYCPNCGAKMDGGNEE